MNANRQIAGAIIVLLETLKEQPYMPESYGYIALQKLGFNLDSFQVLISRLRHKGAVVLSGHCLFAGTSIDTELERARRVFKGEKKAAQPEPEKGPEYCGCDGCLVGQQHFEMTRGEK
jgi:hypothetical protein